MVVEVMMVLFSKRNLYPTTTRQPASQPTTALTRFGRPDRLTDDTAGLTESVKLRSDLSGQNHQPFLIGLGMTKLLIN